MSTSNKILILKTSPHWNVSSYESSAGRPRCVELSPSLTIDLLVVVHVADVLVDAGTDVDNCCYSYL